MKHNSENERLFFSGSMKMADLVDSNSDLLGVLSRMGIRFGFGDGSVEETCSKWGVSTNTFLLICNVYTFDGYTPSTNILKKADVKDIVKYLHQSHSFYMDNALKDLEGSIEKMLEPCSGKQKSIIWTFFRQYREELEKHFDYEEKTVFPYVESVIGHSEKKGFTIGQYKENHSNIEEKLGDLKNIVMKYMPKECDDRLISAVLMNLYGLEKDLEKHTSIEDDILVPLVKRMEEEDGRKE